MLEGIIKDLVAGKSNIQPLRNGAALTWNAETRMLAAGREVGEMLAGDIMRSWSLEAAKFEEYIDRAGLKTAGRRAAVVERGSDGVRRVVSRWHIVDELPEQIGLFGEGQAESA